MTIIRLLALLAGAAVCAFPQAQDVVFANAYERVFLVTNCTNATPIVVTYAEPGTDNPLTFVPFQNGSLVTITGVLGNTNCNVIDSVIANHNAVANTFELTGVAGNGAFTGCLASTNCQGSTDTIVDANTPSIVLPNESQGGSLISVEFPNAAGTVTPVQVRIEAAYTCPDPPFCATGDWRPISIDVEEVQSIGGTFYNLVKANGTWRAYRVNSILATPGTEPMRVFYTGFPYPIGSVVNLGDRFNILQPGEAAPVELEFVAGACQNGTASSAFNTTAAAPAAACSGASGVGGNQTLATLAFDDTATECVEDAFRFSTVGSPPALAADVIWQANASGTVQWRMEGVCGAPGANLGGLAYAVVSTGTFDNGTADDITASTLSFWLPGCDTGDLYFYRFCRVGGVGTLTGDALLKSLTIRGGQ